MKTKFCFVVFERASCRTVGVTFRLYSETSLTSMSQELIVRELMFKTRSIGKFQFSVNDLVSSAT
jgi:hypothetical protein